MIKQHRNAFKEPKSTIKQHRNAFNEPNFIVWKENREGGGGLSINMNIISE
jgi:hypothetical protein